MRFIGRIALFAALAMILAGCAGYHDRRIILNELDPAPMPEWAWDRACGSYTGPIRATSLRGGFEGENAMETRLDLSGPADAPAATLRIESGFSTAWAMYGERAGTYSNIPANRYGSQGIVYVSTHAPNQLLIKTRRFGASAGTGSWLILTFRGNGTVDVDWIGHSGWRGDGELWRLPTLARQM